MRRGRPRLLRRSRGYAPFPVPLPRALPQVLACGAELKNTFCLTRDANAFLSQHIGDLENIETLEHFEASVELYKTPLPPAAGGRRLRPAPGVPGDQVRARSAGRGVQATLGVQHHHAHVAACLAEHGHTGPVIGVSMDGLGFGADGALWGGEVLLCDYVGYRRAAHFEYLPLPGGELAIRRPARTAAGWLLTLLGDEALARARGVGLRIGDERGGGRAPAGRRRRERAAHLQLRAPFRRGSGARRPALGRHLRGPGGHRAGDGLGGRRRAVPVRDRRRAGGGVGGRRRRRPPPMPAPHRPRPAARPHPLAPLFAAVLDDLEAGRSPAFVGSRLHAGLAALVVDVCRRLRASGAPPVVALSGGVFQNRLLSELCEAGLEAAGFTVLTHELVPANDGGLSLGQAVVAGYTRVAATGR